jgi:hypothetical protein
MSRSSIRSFTVAGSSSSGTFFAARRSPASLADRAPYAAASS